MPDLRCPSRLHGVLSDGLIEIKCSSSRCGAGGGVVVMHYFDPSTYALVKTKQFQSPDRLFKKENTR